MKIEETKAWELNEKITCQGQAIFTHTIEQLAIEAVAETKTLIEQKDELIDFILDVDFLTTAEFCEKYGIDTPEWRGNVKLAASEFIRIDAIKAKMFIDKAKELRRGGHA